MWEWPVSQPSGLSIGAALAIYLGVGTAIFAATEQSARIAVGAGVGSALGTALSRGGHS